MNFIELISPENDQFEREHLRQLVFGNHKEKLTVNKIISRIVQCAR